MACDIANGRVEACKDSISGMDAVYIANYVELDSADIDYNVTDTDMIDTITGIATVYKYELKGANSLSETIQTSRDNGTTYVEQVLTIQLKGQDAKTQKTVKLLSYGRPIIFVKTRTNKFKVVGLFRGADLTAGTIDTGAAMGDFNGYNLTFTAMENTPANFLNATTETQFATTVLGGASVVTT